VVKPVSTDIIQKDLESDRLWRERRHANWTLNYELARDTVITNRLTQRQSVNVPYMKKTLKSTKEWFAFAGIGDRRKALLGRSLHLRPACPLRGCDLAASRC